jgi:hypothetical protein
LSAAALTDFAIGNHRECSAEISVDDCFGSAPRSIAMKTLSIQLSFQYRS